MSASSALLLLGAAVLLLDSGAIDALAVSVAADDDAGDSYDAIFDTTDYAAIQDYVNSIGLPAADPPSTPSLLGVPLMSSAPSSLPSSPDYVADPYDGALNGKSISFANANPINLRPGGATWQGQTGTMSVPGKGTFLTFASPEDGYRAAAITLINYKSIYGADTLSSILNRAAPAADQNDPASYVAQVSAATGIDPSTPLDFKSDPQALVSILGAMTKVESGGYQPYQLTTIQEGVRRALAHFGL
jgi:hypothetical protein